MKAFFKKYSINDTVIAAGVSGGADSLALVWQLHQWAEENGRKVIALTVDHGLRSESRDEAEYVADLMAKWGIEHHILIWEGAKPSNGIEAKAREARYRLMADWCRENGVKVLATGHHLQDQAETVLMRLCRGSGLYGLSAISPVSRGWGLLIIRPQLDKKPEDLRALLQKLNVEWKEDSSNQCEDFFRTKIRRFLPVLEQQIGVTRERLAETAAVLSNSRGLIEELTEQIIAEKVSDCLDAAKSFSQTEAGQWHPELRYRILGALIKEVGQRPYLPESAELLRLSQQILQPKFKGCTLGGCEIISCRGKIWLISELKNKPVLKRQLWSEWSKRFPQLQNVDLPYKVRQAIYLLNCSKEGI